MFFTPELLARRDSGFGLLWLAATLGSKSTFKKLPKRSVLTADISQLCDLIAEPDEPLALRLSSNLMVGVARVYKVKQELFMTDVTTCYNTLKRVVNEIAMSDAALQMAQSSVRPGALTLDVDPRMAYAMDFDHLVADWDQLLSLNERSRIQQDSDDDFDPTQKRSQKQVASKKGAKPSLPGSERVRADPLAHTLDESHDHLLAQPFDGSFSFYSGEGGDVSSSQAPGGFELDDLLFDGLDAEGGIGDELARELGEGWGAAPLNAGPADPNAMNLDAPIDCGFGDMDLGGNFDFGDMGEPTSSDVPMPPPSSATKAGGTRAFMSDKENLPPSSLAPSDATPKKALSPLSFSQQLLSQDLEAEIAAAVTPRPSSILSEKDPNVPDKPRPKKAKRVRLLLDSRIELTDEELKTARMQYCEGQDTLRHEMELKRTERESGKIVENMIWNVPSGLRAPDLIDFWSNHFKVQVEARTGAIQLDMQREGPPSKRRKVTGLSPIPEREEVLPDVVDGVDFAAMDMDFGNWMNDGMGDMPEPRHSSEEPGQARRLSREPSLQRDLGFGSFQGTQDPQGNSQRSSLFPWDHAGGGTSSSIFGGAVSHGGGSDRISVDKAEVRLRRSSRSGSISRRSSSLAPHSASHAGSFVGSGVEGFSPGVSGLERVSAVDGEDFQFDLPDEAGDSQATDPNLITLERNSFNFLEYSKMQSKTLSDPSSLSFNLVVPQATSTRRVAAAGFYHCLVLATKDLISISQEIPYGPISIAVPGVR